MTQQKKPRISYKIISLPTVVSKVELRDYIMVEGQQRAIERFKEECKLPDGLGEKILSNLNTATVYGSLFQIVAILMLVTEVVELTGYTYGAFYEVEGTNTNSTTSGTSTEPYLLNYLMGTLATSMSWNKAASTLGYLGFQTLALYTWARGDQHNKTDKSETTGKQSVKR